MPRQSLPRLLKSAHSSLISARWGRMCAAERDADPASDSEMSADDYLRLSDDHLALAKEQWDEAEQMVRLGTKRQFIAWLAHPDSRVRRFVIETMGGSGE